MTHTIFIFIHEASNSLCFEKDSPADPPKFKHSFSIQNIFHFGYLEVINAPTKNRKRKKAEAVSKAQRSLIMSRDRDRGGDVARVYIGDLGSGGSKPELEREFERYGPLKSVWVARNPPGMLLFRGLSPCP